MKKTQHMIDARMISYFTKGSKPTNIPSKRLYLSYTSYDLISVQKLSVAPENPTVENSPLTAAYIASLNSFNTDIAYRQGIIALTDITIDSANKNAYTQEEIDDFWNSDQPILFISMLNIKPDLLDKTKNNILDFFPRERTRIYYTFDNFDIIIFYKGHKFCDYANLIFNLCFKDRTLTTIIDSMTVYGINPSATYADISDEKYNVMIRYGIDDFDKLRSLFSPEISEANFNSLLLGRNDGCIYCENVNLKWLQKCMKKIDRNRNGILHNIEITVLGFPMDSIEGKTIGRNRNKAKVNASIQKLERTTYKCYHQLFLKGKVDKIDSVFRRWFSLSRELACSLYNNELSSEIGTCIVPQYTNYLIYLNRLIAYSMKNDIDISDIVAECQKEFFTNILTLMDSMNHSDRQFFQTPSFHSVSFELPPKLLACYTAFIFYLIKAFQDDETNFYGYMVSPRFVQELDVYSLKNNNVGNDNFLSINISEKSIYSITHTTEALSHEISHFVGHKSRCREIRKQYIIKYGVRLLILSLVSDLITKTISDTKYQDYGECIESKINETELFELVDNIYQLLIKQPNWSYDSDEYNYLRYISDWVLEILPTDIARLPEAVILITQWICKCFLSQEDGKRNYIYDAWMDNINQIIGDTKDLSLREEVVILEAKEWVSERLEGKGDYFKQEIKDPNSVSCSLGDYICYLFSETFADLQTIILYNLQWDNYINLIIYEDEDILPSAITRVLAISKAMIYKSEGSAYWDIESIMKRTIETPRIMNIKQLLVFDPQMNNKEFKNKSVDPVLIIYLTEYLKSCRQAITYALNNNNKKAIKMVQNFHKIAGEDGITIHELEKQIMKFLIEFQNDFEKDMLKLE